MTVVLHRCTHPCADRMMPDGFEVNSVDVVGSTCVNSMR